MDKEKLLKYIEQEMLRVNECLDNLELQYYRDTDSAYFEPEIAYNQGQELALSRLRAFINHET